MTRSLLPISRWSPLSYHDLRKEMNRLVEGMFDSEQAEPSFFAPRANFAETETGYELSLDVPGVQPDEFNVEYKDGHLWVTGERKDESEEKGKTFHRIERSYGQFRRVVALGDDVDAENIEASYKDGVLTVVVPKAPAATSKRIDVKS